MQPGTGQSRVTLQLTAWRRLPTQPDPIIPADLAPGTDPTAEASAPILTELSSLRYRMPVAGQWSQSSIISLLTTDSSVRIQSCSCESRNQVTTKPRIRLSAAKCLIILTATPKFSHRISTIPATWQGYGWGQGATCTPCYAGTPA